jgi:hypothetical protein
MTPGQYSRLELLHCTSHLLCLSFMTFSKESEHWNDLLSIGNRPTEEDMLADLENDLELIRQEIK